MEMSTNCNENKKINSLRARTCILTFKKLIILMNRK